MQDYLTDLKCCRSEGISSTTNFQKKCGVEAHLLKSTIPEHEKGLSYEKFNTR